MPKLLCSLLVMMALAFATAAQSSRSKQSGGEGKKNNRPDAARDEQSQPKSETNKEDAAVAEADVLRVETNLVTVPVIASTRGGSYIPDLKQEEFTIYEDGVKQEVAFFATVTEPFHVVLMIDTSASTEEKLSQIERAANAFVAQLQEGDRVKLISFDDKVRDYGNFTNNRALLNGMIGQLRPGRGTKLYDAMNLALKALEQVKGRKAIVIFTDGVDWHSDMYSSEENFRAIEESGVILYPIRYETRAETERLAREQARGGQSIDLGTIFGTGGTPRSTPPIVPGGGTIPTGTGGVRLPLPVVINRGGTTGRTTGPDTSTGIPDPRTDPSARQPTSQPTTDTSISQMLDAAYKEADRYLNDLAFKSGGRLLRADTLVSLPNAFAQIAAELRTQYSLGYYPPVSSRDGKLHKIQVRTTRKDISVRSRPAYRSKAS